MIQYMYVIAKKLLNSVHTTQNYYIYIDDYLRGTKVPHICDPNAQPVNKRILQ